MRVQKKAVEITAQRIPQHGEGKPLPDGVDLDDLRTNGSPLFVKTKEGPYYTERGEWVITGVEGERWPISDEKFRAIYDHVAGDTYCSKPHQRDAIKMPNAFTIHCSGGDLTGKEGDWLVLATPDDAYPVDAAIFDATYEVVDADPAKAQEITGGNVVARSVVLSLKADRRATQELINLLFSELNSLAWVQ